MPGKVGKLVQMNVRFGNSAGDKIARQVLSAFVDPDLDIEQFRGNKKDLPDCQKWQVQMGDCLEEAGLARGGIDMRDGKQLLMYGKHVMNIIQGPIDLVSEDGGMSFWPIPNGGGEGCT